MRTANAAFNTSTVFAVRPGLVDGGGKHLKDATLFPPAPSLSTHVLLWINWH